MNKQPTGQADRRAGRQTDKDLIANRLRFKYKLSLTCLVVGLPVCLSVCLAGAMAGWLFWMVCQKY
jgi:hypothetical protein